MRRLFVLATAVALAVAAAVPAASAGHGDPPHDPEAGRAFGDAVSDAATSAPGAVSDPAKAGQGPGGLAPPGAGIAATRSHRPGQVPGLPVYLALGDSWAYGQGAADPATGGYVAQLHEALLEHLDCLPAASEDAADGCRRLQLLNLGRPARDGLPGVTTPLVESEQLPIALPLLEDRNGDDNPRNDVELVTLHVGGNDVSGPIQEACLGGFVFDPCIVTWVALMAQYEADLTSVVSQLRAAAGADTPIVLGTYDNTVPTCVLFDLFGPDAILLGEFALEGTPAALGGLDGVHDVVRRVAAAFGAEVAEVFGTLDPADFVGGDDCLHLVDSGYAKVAGAFLTEVDG